METRKKTMLPVMYIVRMFFLGIVLLAGLFWTWFGIASGIEEKLGFLGTVMHSLIPGVLLVGISLIAWRWAQIGGLLLVGMGVAFFFFFHVQNIFVFLLLVLPMVLTGLLFLFTKQPTKRDTSTTTT